MVDEPAGRDGTVLASVLRRNRELAAAGLPRAYRTAPAPAPDDAGPSVRPPPAARDVLALIATRNYIPFAKLAARSFVAFHPEFRPVLLLVDGEQRDATMFPEGEVVLLADLAMRHAGWHAAKFAASEFTNALKPTFLRYLAATAERVVYLDCDIAVFSRLDEMIDMLATSELILVPHMLEQPPRPEQFWVRPNRADIFNSGLVNGGCFALRPAKCLAFLDFWHEANFAPGAFFREAGYQTDQQHLNWAMVKVPGAQLLRDTRYNVAYWNLHDRDFHVEFDADGTTRFLVDRRPLGCFHFSGYDIFDRLQISRHDGRHLVYAFPAIAAILNWYSDELQACPLAGLMHEPYRFDQLPNGVQLTPFIRDLLKRYEYYLPRFDALTVEGADALCGCLMDVLPATGSLLPLVAAAIYEARADLRAAYPGAHTPAGVTGYWRWFCRHAGGEHQVQPLIDRFRRALPCDLTAAFAEKVSTLLRGAEPAFLGTGRVAAARRLRLLGEETIADALLESIHEWHVATDLDAAFELYLRRADLRATFPDVLGRDHAAYAEWLKRCAVEEHDAPPDVGARFARCGASVSLARIFSFLARDARAAEVARESLLADDPEPILRQLTRGASEGLEYDLDDVTTLRFIHATSRHLLVPLYLELPPVRMQDNASRVAETSVLLLPEAIRREAWALRGCEAHGAYFDRFEASLDEEMRRWFAGAAHSSEVIGFLRATKREEPAVRAVEAGYRAAARRLPPDDTGRAHGLALRLAERKHKPSVNVFGFFASDIGVGESTRGLAQAISLLRPVNRVPFTTGQIQEGTEVSALFQRYDYLSDTNVFVSYPHKLEDVFGLTRPEQLAGRRNIAHLAWEQKEANPWWKNVYDRYDEIWTISEFAATAFRRLFPDRVRVVPNVLDFEGYPVREAPSPVREQMTFLYAFDANSSMERKNPEGVLEAFRRAFQGTGHAGRVELVLKVGGMHRPEHAERVEDLMRAAQASGLAIRFDGRQLGREAMLRTIAAADCYVSLHRAEGFGYTMAEAMFYGLPVVASGYSGNLEYMTPDNSFLVPCEETFVKRADGPFQRGSIWGEPDLDVAAALLRQVAEAPDEARAVGERGRRQVMATLSAAAVAERIRSAFGPTDPPPGAAGEPAVPQVATP